MHLVQLPQIRASQRSVRIECCERNGLCDRDKSFVYSIGFVFQQIRKGKVSFIDYDFTIQIDSVLLNISTTRNYFTNMWYKSISCIRVVSSTRTCARLLDMLRLDSILSFPGRIFYWPSQLPNGVVCLSILLWLKLYPCCF